MSGSRKKPPPADAISAPAGSTRLALDEVEDWWQQGEEDNQRIVAAVARKGTAPAPFEGHDSARLLALGDLVQSERPFGLGRMPRGFNWLSGAEKLDLLLELDDPRATVQALACDEFVFLVKDIGMADAAALLALASPRQLQATVDLDGWQGDMLDRLDVAHWLAIALTAGPETVDRFVASVGDDVWTLLLASSLQVFETAEEAEAGAAPDAEVFTTPGNDLVLAAAPQDPLLPALRTTIEALYRGSVERGRQVVRAIRWELPAQLEEDAFLGRNLRIADHGFMGTSQAREFYAYVDPDQEKQRLLEMIRGEVDADGGVRPFIAVAEPPRTGLALAGYQEEGLLGRALAACPQSHQSRLHHALVRLAYRAQSARAKGLAEFAELPQWSRHALTTCDMGLAFVSDGQIEVATMLLQMEPLDSLFQVGHGLVVRLHHRARAIRALLGGVAGVDLLEPEDAALLGGLLRPLPELGTLRPPDEVDEENPAVACRPFETLSEVRDTEVRLAAIAAAARLLSELGEGTLAAIRDRLAAEVAEHQQSDLRLTSMLATAIAWTVLEGSARLAPLSVQQGQLFLQRAFETTASGRRIAMSLRKALSRSLLATPDLQEAELVGLEDLVERTLDRLDEELGGLDPNAPFEPRFVGAALVLKTA